MIQAVWRRPDWADPYRVSYDSGVSIPDDYWSTVVMQEVFRLVTDGGRLKMQ